MKSFLNFAKELAKILIIALVIVIPIRYFVFQPFLVHGESMEPTFSTGDYLIIDELSYRFRDPGRGEVVVFRYPENPSEKYIKRIIGLPGETVKIEGGEVIIVSSFGEIILNESEYLDSSITTSIPRDGVGIVNLGSNEYFVLGDNRPYSSDSRTWGVLPKENIVGRALFQALPPQEIGKVDSPSY